MQIFVAVVTILWITQGVICFGLTVADLVRKQWRSAWLSLAVTAIACVTVVALLMAAQIGATP